MIIHKAYQFRIYPNKQQEAQINQTIGCCRFVFNYYLAKRNEAYKANRKTLHYSACSADLTQLKKELTWLKEADSTALQSSLKDLDDAYSRFFKKQNNFPTFKSKRTAKKSYTSKQTRGNIAIIGNTIKLPKLGLVTFAKSRDVDGRILHATIRRSPSGKYVVSILVETEVHPLPANDRHIGIDVGMAYFAITSEGEFYDNPRFLRRYEKQLTKLQIGLSRKYEQAKKDNRKLIDSKNYNKNRIQVARMNERITHCRNDFLHKLTTKLIRENQTISIEDLQVSSLVQNHNLAKSIADAAWSRFRTMLGYKAEWYGRTLVAVDPKYTSQTCHTCGHVAKENRPNQATFRCVRCGHVDHADVNAAKNIKARTA